MNLRTLLSSFCLLLSLTVGAANSVTTQSATITGSVTVSSAVDYTITASTPFSGSGSVNITNTDHGVVIFKSIRPSVVVSTWLKYLRINGQTAVDGTNCQVKMYNRGAIVLPYASDFKPLTCYTGQNYTGSSCNTYGTGHSGGYMNTLSQEQLANRIRSFKLKRGYMVTFAVGTAGWGYSRCFIADKEDLEVASLPAVLDGKISSYRIFRWQNARKSGLANDVSSAANGALNSSWCYNFNVGESRTPDQECVPHRIQRWWPGIADIGQKTYSAHMKTDNEPANQSDDNPASVSEVLGYWEDVMRTGMRLCSPSAHDGGYTWLKEFMTTIDERGWRCDIIDVHGYWTESQLSGLQTTYNTYKRPIWVSELLWGASWSGSGIFAKVSDTGSNSSSNQQANYDGAKPMLDKLNSYGYVERYAWWNSEAVCSKVYHNNALTKLGEYYATMEAGIGYSKAYEYVPTVVISRPGTPTVTVSASKISLSWTDVNGDMVDRICVQYRAGSSSSWQTLGTVDRKDKTGSGAVSYSVSYDMTAASDFAVRIVDSFDGKDYVSDEVSMLSGSGWITSFPSNYEDFYYMFYSSEAKTDLCWTLGWDGKTTDISYQSPKAVGTDLSQVWQIEANSKSTGYSLRNLAAYDYVMCSPNAWNFTTNNATYHVSDAKTGYLPSYESGGFWVVANCNYSGNYVGLWDNDKQFAAGERLAANRGSVDAADHLRIYAILKTEFNETYVVEQGHADVSHAIANPNFSWGTESSSVSGSGANNIPALWSFTKTFGGWNDSNVATETIRGASTYRFNTWAGTFTYAELSQTVNHLPNGIYKLSADLATTENTPRNTSRTCIYGNPLNNSNIARSYNLLGMGNNSYEAYACYFLVDNNRLTIGVRSDGTWFKVANFKLEYVCRNDEASEAIKRELLRGRALQRWFFGQTKGDINLDLRTDISDMPALINILNGHATDYGTGDVNRDSSVDLKDVEELKSALLE